MDTSKYATMQSGRGWLQFGGARPQNGLFFYDQSVNAFAITGVSDPVSGGVSAINVAGDRPNTYRRAGVMVEAPDLPSFTLSFREKTGSIPRQWLLRNCGITVYEPNGECKSLANFEQGWSSYVMIYSNARVTDRSGDRTSHDSADVREAELSMVADAIYPVGGLIGGNVNGTGITLEILDATFGNNERCPDCGPADDGTRRIYAIEKGGAAAKPIVHYSVDGGATWGTSSISVAANAETPCAIRVMGNYLVVLSPTANTATRGGYYYSVINSDTGVPSSVWTKVVAGFSDAFEPRDMVVLSAREAYVCCDAGEVLTINDVPSGAVSLGVFTTSDLARIGALGTTVVAVGAAGTVIVSNNRGKSFATTTVAPSASALTAVQVMADQRFFVGDSAGGVFYTEVAGATAWMTVSTGIAMAAIQDIKFATPEVGYIAYTIAGTLARVAATINGGRSWVASDLSSNPRIAMPTASLQRYNRIAIPDTSDSAVNAGTLLAVGLGAATDGCAVLAASSVF